MTKKQESIVTALAYMQELFGHYPQTELQYETPFQLLVAVMLSAQTTDKQVNKVTEKLFSIVKTPHDLVDLWEERFGKMIRTVWLWTSKAKNVYATAEILMKNEQWTMKNRVFCIESYANSDALYEVWWYRLPDTVAGMMTLPGVGVKTAKVVIPMLYGTGQIAVDTHVQRVSHRLGRVDTSNPDQTSKQLEELIPEEQKMLAHKVMIYFWRYHCMARNPKCQDCKLQQVCRWYRENEKLKAKK